MNIYRPSLLDPKPEPNPDPNPKPNTEPNPKFDTVTETRHKTINFVGFYAPCQPGRVQGHSISAIEMQKQGSCFDMP